MCYCDFPYFHFTPKMKNDRNISTFSKLLYNIILVFILILLIIYTRYIVKVKVRLF